MLALQQQHIARICLQHARAPSMPPLQSAHVRRRHHALPALLLLAAVAGGATVGLCAARLCRAVADDAAEEQRQRFHALYADPTADVDDLPLELPRCALRCCTLGRDARMAACAMAAQHHVCMRKVEAPG